jgi:hypothetical protein
MVRKTYRFVTSFSGSVFKFMNKLIRRKSLKN